MSNINELVYEIFNEGYIGNAALGAGATTGMLLGTAGFIPGIGSAVTGTTAAGSQLALDNIRDQQADLIGQARTSKLSKGIHAVTSGLVGSIPIVGGFYNGYKLRQLLNADENLNRAKTNIARAQLAKNGMRPILPQDEVVHPDMIQANTLQPMQPQPSMMDRIKGLMPPLQ